ncbi:MAG: S8 family serine peptidase [Sedimentisphaerales bacterium]|nr:S8 family serine peptidase [Sedimentisphaerales bacterium]
MKTTLFLLYSGCILLSSICFGISGLTQSSNATLSVSPTDYDFTQTPSTAGPSQLARQRQKAPQVQSVTPDIEMVNGKAAVPGEVLVSFRPGRAGKIPGIRNKMKAKELKVIRKTGVHRWRLESKKSVAQAIKELSANPDVKYAEANYLVYAAAVPNDPLQGKLWGLHNTGQTGGTPDADIDAPEAWNIVTGSDQVVVGLIDSGVDYMHPDLAANIWTNEAERNGIAGVDDDNNGYMDDIYGWDFLSDDNDPYDETGHGTHCAGTIGALGNNASGVAGVNWNVKIMALKFLNAQNMGNTADAIEAIDYAAMMRQRGVNIALTSNSWGGTAFSQALLDAVAAARQAGMLFVAAAGNGNIDTDITPNYPSSFDLDNIISVAATDHHDQRASFSNWGAVSVDLGAPGVDIWSTIRGNGYLVYSGTSMAAPHVAGVAALAWSMAPGSSYTQIRDAILTGVDPVNMDQPTATGGRLNAFNTLASLAMIVTKASPGDEEVYVSPYPPARFTIQFSSPVDRRTLQPADLKVNDRKADRLTVSHDNRTVTFYYNFSPVRMQGPQKMYMLANAIRAMSGVSSSPNLKAWTAAFRWDKKEMDVIQSGPMAPFVQLPLTSMTIAFNEPYDPASIQTEDLTLSQGQVVKVIKNTASQITYVLSGINQEGRFTAAIPAGAVTDIYGNPMPSYSAGYNLDYGVVPFPMELQPAAPLGSLVHEGAVSGAIAHSDIDTFTLTVDPRQTVSVLITPDESLCPVLGLSSLWTNQVIPAGGPGQSVLLQLEPTADVVSTQTLSVSGLNTSGNYTLEILLNSAMEQENLDGIRNDDISSAQNIDAAFNDLNDAGGQRTAVCGKIQWEFTPFQTVEDFEDQTLTEYLSTSTNMDGFSIIPSAAHDGLQGLEVYGLAGQWIYRNDPLVHVQQGSLISVWIRSEATMAGRAYFGFGADAAGTLSVVMAGNTKQLLLHRNPGFGYEILAEASQQWLANHWYRMEISWRPGGDIIVDLFDSDGTTLLNSITGSDAAVTSGGIAFRGFLGAKYFDTVQVASPTNTDPDFYALSLSQGQSLSAVMKTTGGKAAIELLDAAGTVLAAGTESAANADVVMDPFIAPAAGTYYLRVSGVDRMQYQVVLTRDGVFERECNDKAAFAGQITSHKAILGHIDAPAVVGYFTDFYPASRAPGHVIRQAGFIPVQIFDITTFDLSTVEVLMVNELNNAEISPELLSRLPDIEAWVRDGGLLVVHDRFVSTDIGDPQPNPLLIGAPATMVDRDFVYGNDIDVIIPDTLLTAGPNGVIDNDTLDAANFSSHGFAVANTLPAGSVSLLSTGPAANHKVAAFAYALGRGFVYYAAIPLDYFLEIYGDNSFKTIYAPNLLLYMNSLKPDEDWFHLTVNPWSKVLLESRTPADGPGEFINALDPMIRIYDAAGGLLGSADNNALDGRNAAITVSADNDAVDYLVQVASSELAAPTRGTYVVSQKIYSDSKIVRVDSITYSTTGGKNQDKHLLVTIELKDNLGSPVANASVSAALSHNGLPGTLWFAATDVNGRVTFNYNNAPPGTYTTVITDVTAADLTWDGITPPNVFTK